MHIPDGFISAGTSLAAGVVSAGGIGVALKKTTDTMEEKQAPLAGLVAAFVFAAQMLNFPVALGTSGHLLGGVLATVLVGPWAGAIWVALVLVVRWRFFAVGGRPRRGCRGEGGGPRVDRGRGGRHHRPHGERRARRAPGPRVRRPPPAAATRAAGSPAPGGGAGGVGRGSLASWASSSRSAWG